jgi:DNA processing protein
MIIKKLTLTSPDFPEVLRNIPSPRRQLYVAGAPLAGLLQRPRVAIVGTRKISPYGQQVTWEFARDLAQQGVVIISGLALGLDALAHKAALEHGGLCIAVLPCPLEKIVPMTNRRLAQRILDSGGALVSEYPEPEWPKRQYFIARNRIVSGLADAVLIPEAGIKSGALHTARFAVEQGKNMLAVPGSIYAPGCAGTNNLIKTSQAGAVTTPDDVLNTLDLQRHSTPAKQVKGANAREQAILDLLLQGISKGHLLLEHSRLEVPAFNQTLVMLEITGKIRPLGADHWAIT